MIIRYALLFRISLHHSYFTDGAARSLVLEPTDDCRDLLRRYSLIYRAAEHGGAVYCETKADGTTMVRPFDGEHPRFRFLLKPTDSTFLPVTSLPAGLSPGKRVFCFDNLQDLETDGELLLGNDEGVHPTTVFPVVSDPLYRFRFDAPVNSATFTLLDIFGNEFPAGTLALPEGETTGEWPINLNAVERLVPGRYTVKADTDGGEETAAMLYLPGLFGSNLLGVVELFADTADLTDDESNSVPEPYRFVEGEELSGEREFVIDFEARSVTVRYVVRKLYDSNTHDLEKLEIEGDTYVAAPVSDDGTTRTFTSDGVRLMQQQPAALKLLHREQQNGEPDTVTTLRTLPGPNAAAPLKELDDAYVSDIYISI